MNWGRWVTIHVFTSSMMMIAALLSSALAMHRSCLCPTEKFDPFSSTTEEGVENKRMRKIFTFEQ
jgi:hypothetical protein